MHFTGTLAGAELLTKGLAAGATEGENGSESKALKAGATLKPPLDEASKASNVPDLAVETLLLARAEIGTSEAVLNGSVNGTLTEAGELLDALTGALEGEAKKSSSASNNCASLELLLMMGGGDGEEDGANEA